MRNLKFKLGNRILLDSNETGTIIGTNRRSEISYAIQLDSHRGYKLCREEEVDTTWLEEVDLDNEKVKIVWAREEDLELLSDLSEEELEIINKEFNQRKRRQCNKIEKEIRELENRIKELKKQYEEIERHKII